MLYSSMYMQSLNLIIQLFLLAVKLFFSNIEDVSKDNNTGQSIHGHRIPENTVRVVVLEIAECT